MPTHILGVSGSTTRDARTRKLLDIAMAGAKEAGAETRIVDLRETVLPVYCSDDESQGALPAVQLVKESATWADGFLLATPEYHGGLSGALKNWFDFLYEELSGKVATAISQTGGGGGEMSIMAVKTQFQWCHGFVIPFHTAAKSADWNKEGLTNDRVRDRLGRLGHDIVRYAEVIRPAWEAAKRVGKGPAAGFAGFHVE